LRRRAKPSPVSPKPRIASVAGSGMAVRSSRPSASTPLLTTKNELPTHGHRIWTALDQESEAEDYAELMAYQEYCGEQFIFPWAEIRDRILEEARERILGCNLPD